eukprot:1638756-Prymnesium_polylepis.1
MVEVPEPPHAKCLATTSALDAVDDDDLRKIRAESTDFTIVLSFAGSTDNSGGAEGADGQLSGGDALSWDAAFGE